MRKKGTILITGCSSGIGLCAATILQQRGYRVFATARKAADVEQLERRGLEALQLDVTNPDSIRLAIEAVLQATGGTLDALFNNAGYMLAGAIEDLTETDYRAQFETNVIAPMTLIREVLPVMRKQGYGRIIQNSSVLGLVPIPFFGAYNASKFALEGASQTLYQELSGTAIHLSIINPGPVHTRLHDNTVQLYQAARPQFQQSIHHARYQTLEKGERKKYRTASPEAVVNKLVHALESKRPRLHYFVGFDAATMILIKRFLPDKLILWLLARFS